MKNRIGIIFFGIVLAIIVILVVPLHCQTPPKPMDVAIKDTPASQSLIELSKKYVADNQTFQTARQQAISTLDQKVKVLQDELAKQQKALHDQEASDKKYKPMIDRIDDLQKQIADAGADANKKFAAEIGTVQQNIGVELAQINALISVVKSENSLSADAQYATDTQKWTVPSKTPAPPASAK